MREINRTWPLKWLVAYRHGLRVGELTDLRWEDVHLDGAEIYVRRLKGSKSTMQPLQGDELRALRKLRRENTSSLCFVFISEQGGPLGRRLPLHSGQIGGFDKPSRTRLYFPHTADPRHRIEARDDGRHCGSHRLSEPSCPAG